ncbi:MAG: bifunctional (p)ppGpp synthetase/guanosine-3',5'-bis(diphosphate) 3'-pyrophosphohydrolase [Ruminococcaceae bacterium]|nr:bifunctional (p)ppGpp synthetase/guanosine-3',5'-bis(diphosphate) 3'-pyrophosphohydrolase [Oscillospiraceae bacterium]
MDNDKVNSVNSEAEIHTDIDRLIGILKATGKNYDIDKVTRAYEYADKLHEGQFRQSGDKYISHPIAVAEIVAGLELDTDAICAALLHDTVEDCADKTNLSDLKKLFGEDVAVLVDGLTKLVELQVEDKEEAHIENLRKMLLAMSRDIRVIFIKLCDRLHNMRTLSAKADSKRRTIALETMQVYAPLAHRLGMQKIKHELENLSLEYLDPFGYEEVGNHIEEKYGQNLGLIENLRNHVDSKLRENNINFTLEGRIKSIYSIYKKMYNQNKSFDEIYDFYALRVIVDTELECYTVLGIIHEMYKSIPGRFKDYISTPKPNMYRSLHTTVIGRDGVPFEVQIRTWEMHHIAEYGVAAHWKYKSGERSKADMDKKLEWIARLIETEDDTRDPDEFMHAFKTDIFHDETFVFTPKGDVIALPQGSTVIDFAYAIHSAVGNKMVGAKINGMIVPIDKVPQNGEIVEILTSNASKGPSRDWLKIVKTGEAKNKIRQWFKKEKRDENILVGQASIDAELKKFSRSYTDAQRLEVVTNVAHRIGVQTAEDLYNTIGYGGLSMLKILPKLKDEFDKLIKPEVVPQVQTEADIPVKKPKHIRSNSGIIVDGEEGCQVKFAKCCNPLPGDNVIGFVTKGYGISIHKKDCPNVVNGMKNLENASRWVEAEWEADAANQSVGGYEALLQIFAYDSIGILANISMALADMKVSILSINSQKKSDDMFIINLKISCKNIDHYKSIVSRLKGLKNVEDVTRGFS